MFKFNKRVRILGWYTPTTIFGWLDQESKYPISTSQLTMLYRFTGGKRVRRNRYYYSL